VILPSEKQEYLSTKIRPTDLGQEMQPIEEQENEDDDDINQGTNEQYACFDYDFFSKLT